MKNVVVSIVVPVYNMENFLVRCLTSLLQQDKKNIEIILVNDGSTDRSEEICNEYASEYPDLIRVIHKENGGLSSARNTGIIHANGKYIIFPDPDDWVEPNYIEKGLELQEAYNVDLVCLGHYVEYDDRSIPANPDGELTCMNRKEAKRALMVPPAINGFAWNKLFCLDVIRKHDLWFSDDVGTTEDLDFSFRYLEYCDIICFAPEEKVYHYYQRPGAATHGKFSRKRVESIRTYEKIIAKSQDDPKLVEAAENEICNTAINLCWLYKRDNCQEKELWSATRQYLKKYLNGYLKSRNYNVGRKVQAILAYFMPDLYVKLKEQVQRD
ncbi:MAG: glycosyltransferase [Lachnospiraceae bacterium]|nr:glycosyltransferase [Lachnospiraceae bacterium]